MQEALAVPGTPKDGVGAVSGKGLVPAGLAPAPPSSCGRLSVWFWAPASFSGADTPPPEPGFCTGLRGGGGAASVAPGCTGSGLLTVPPGAVGGTVEVAGVREAAWPAGAGVSAGALCATRSTAPMAVAAKAARVRAISPSRR